MKQDVKVWYINGDKIYNLRTSLSTLNFTQLIGYRNIEVIMHIVSTPVNRGVTAA